MALDEGPHLERVKRSDNRRWPIAAIVLGVLLVALAAFHPWAQDSPTGDGSATTVPVANASVAASAAALDPNRMFPQCFPTIGWRVASLQLQAQYKVRTAWPVSLGSLPSATPTNAPTLHGRGVIGIGFCTPGFDAARRALYVDDVTLWRRSTDGKMSRIEGTVIDESLAELGEVYLAPPASLAVNGSWPVGEYFFQIRPTGGVANSSAPAVRWLPLRIVPDPVRKPV